MWWWIRAVRLIVGQRGQVDQVLLELILELFTFLELAQLLSIDNGQDQGLILVQVLFVRSLVVGCWLSVVVVSNSQTSVDCVGSRSRCFRAE